MTEHKDQVSDILILGHGLVAESLWLALRNGPWHTQLLAPARTPGQDARQFALSCGSTRLLQQWGCVLDGMGAAITSIHCSERGSFGHTRFEAADYALPQLGHTLPASALQACLDDTLTACQCTANRDFSELLDVTSDAESSTLHYRDSHNETRQHRCRLLVVAGGPPKGMLARLGLEMKQHDYQQQALVVCARTAVPHHNRAFERFTGSGAMAVLPLHKPDEVAVVWSQKHKEHERCGTLDDEALCQAMQAVFGNQLGRWLALTGPRQGFPLQRHHLPDPIQQRLVLLGTAAHHVHPIGAQGLNLCLRAVRDLAAGLLDKKCIDPGDPVVLHGFARQRRTDTRQVLTATDALVRLFSSSNPVLRLGRNLGMQALDLSPGLKEKWVYQAMFGRF